MNTIHCRIKQNEYQDIPAYDITPAEAVLLRAIHAPADHSLAQQSPPEEQGAYWKCLINPRPGRSIERSNAEEVARLRAKYPVRAKSGAHGSHMIEDLYPGVSPTLPQTFGELGLEVRSPEGEGEPRKGAKDAKGGKKKKEQEQEQEQEQGKEGAA